MDDKVYKLVEVTGTSSENIEDAVNNALARASSSIRNMRWFQVTETRGAIEGGKVAQWQVSMKVGFAIED